MLVWCCLMCVFCLCNDYRVSTSSWGHDHLCRWLNDPLEVRRRWRCQLHRSSHTRGAEPRPRSKDLVAESLEDVEKLLKILGLLGPGAGPGGRSISSAGDQSPVYLQNNWWSIPNIWDYWYGSTINWSLSVTGYAVRNAWLIRWCHPLGVTGIMGTS